ncbi:MAG TPA: STAS domain-containing protein [Terriglobales bacterium]|nr:STAS domain-containing protein [Terriglobales bacterium]
MAMIALQHRIDGERVVPSLDEAREKLDSADGEMILDFSSVCRIDAGALRAMEELAASAGDKGVRLVLRSASTDVYRVLKLMKLTPRFSFLA